ncbi:DUF493 domain-containing protein [Chitinophaga sp. 212800010-3]|uniref:HP0495 family protein n=1 Tax=unclassified Chitinophaga TaxID=2619133 RepID=UPI002DE2758C|nr:DUF493 domain-containing protein [Chitinophaga sp. 212800010-3]
MSKHSNTDSGTDPYDKFRLLLRQSLVFPTEYIYKFIVKSDKDKTTELKQIFANTDAKISETSSSTGKYKSFTVRIYVQDEEEIIGYYKEVSEIDAVIML